LPFIWSLTHHVLLFHYLIQDCLVPRRYEEDHKLATWVETQRVLWNRDYRDGGIELKSSLQLPEPTDVPAVASLALAGKTPEEWAEEIGKPEFGATAEDAAELTATMAEESMHVMQAMDEDAQAAAVMTAAADAAAEAVDGPIGEEAAKMLAANPKRLSQNRKERLDALGFVWSLRNKRIDDHWDEMFRQLVEYKHKHSDCLVPSRYEENLKLGKWVETQRYEYTKLQRVSSGFTEAKPEPEIDTSTGKSRATNPRLTEERLRRLEAIGFEWKVKHKMKRYYDKQWDQMFERLLKFKEDNGHCMVPKRYPPEMKLGTWVHTQRIQYRKMLAGTKRGIDATSDVDDVDLDDAEGGEDDMSYRLTDERRKRLEQVGFIWSAREGEKGTDQSRITRNSYDDQWDNMFQRLEQYKVKHGDCLVPKRFKEDAKL
jgi:hypothetical protein